MFERPTKGDIDRALSTLMHDARHRCTALMLPAKQLSVGSSTPRVKTVNVMLPDQLIDLLRSYRKIDRRLFPTADPQRHITAWELEGVYRQTAEVAVSARMSRCTRCGIALPLTYWNRCGDPGNPGFASFLIGVRTRRGPINAKCETVHNLPPSP
jgi:hypothetical protein